MRRRWSWCLLALALLAAGCANERVPERTADFQNNRDAVRAYHDYLHLERAGIESVHIKNTYFDQVVPLPFYLYLIARTFERLGRSSDAAKLYFRLLIRYPLLEDEDQLGVRVENRLRWLLGDKSWIIRSPAELILRLQQALAAHDLEALERLISRDFGFGSSEENRYAVSYRDGLRLIRKCLEKSPQVSVESFAEPEPGRILVKTSGWEGMHKVWYFSLHLQSQPKGWEWDLAYWDEDQE